MSKKQNQCFLDIQSQSVKFPQIPRNQNMKCVSVWYQTIRQFCWVQEICETFYTEFIRIPCLIRSTDFNSTFYLNKLNRFQFTLLSDQVQQVSIHSFIWTNSTGFNSLFHQKLLEQDLVVIWWSFLKPPFGL